VRGSGAIGGDGVEGEVFTEIEIQASSRGVVVGCRGVERKTGRVGDRVMREGGGVRLEVFESRQWP